MNETIDWRCLIHQLFRYLFVAGCGWVSISWVFALDRGTCCRATVRSRRDESPMLANFLPWNFAFLNEFVERRFGNLQIGCQFVDRENVVLLYFHGDLFVD